MEIDFALNGNPMWVICGDVEHEVIGDQETGEKYAPILSVHIQDAQGAVWQVFPDESQRNEILGALYENTDCTVQFYWDIPSTMREQAA